MNNEFRALCAELVAIEDAMTGGKPTMANQGQALDGFSALASFRDIAARARAELAKPEPPGPTREQAHQLFQALRKPIYVQKCPGAPEQCIGYEPVDPYDFAKATLTRWGNCVITENRSNAIAPDRQTGRTAKQMLDAPRGAIFVWLNSDLHYPRQLAKRIDREDLLIKSLSWLTKHSCVGRGFGAVVLDHEAWQRLSPRNIEALDYLGSRSIQIL